MGTSTGMSGIARALIALAFACGVIGLAGGLTNHARKLGHVGWFAGGCLLALLAIATVLVCGPCKAGDD